MSLVPVLQVVVGQLLSKSFERNVLGEVNLTTKSMAHGFEYGRRTAKAAFSTLGYLLGPTRIWSPKTPRTPKRKSNENLALSRISKPNKR